MLKRKFVLIAVGLLSTISFFLSSYYVMVYSDQLMLIDEFQRHFDSLWSQTDIYGSKRHVIGELTALRNQCAKHLDG